VKRLSTRRRDSSGSCTRLQKARQAIRKESDTEPQERAIVTQRGTGRRTTVSITPWIAAASSGRSGIQRKRTSSIPPLTI